MSLINEFHNKGVAGITCIIKGKQVCGRNCGNELKNPPETRADIKWEDAN